MVTSSPKQFELLDRSLKKEGVSWAVETIEVDAENGVPFTVHFCTKTSWDGFS